MWTMYSDSIDSNNDAYSHVFSGFSFTAFFMDSEM